MAKIKTQSKGIVESSEKVTPEVQEEAPTEVQASVVEAAPLVTPASSMPTEAETLPAASAISDHLKRKYRVKIRTTISFYGQIVVLPADSVVSAEGYGPEGLQRIIDANVPLEKLE